MKRNPALIDLNLFLSSSPKQHGKEQAKMLPKSSNKSLEQTDSNNSQQQSN